MHFVQVDFLLSAVSYTNAFKTAQFFSKEKISRGWLWLAQRCVNPRKMAMRAGCVNLVLNVGGRNKHDSVSEWLRRWTRNLLGLPAGVRIPSMSDVWLQRCVVWERERREGSGAIASSHCLVLGLCHGACSVAATYKPPMLVPRARLPAFAYALQQYEKECV